MTLRERLARAAELGVTVALSPAEVKELLAGGEPHSRGDEDSPDLSVGEVAARLNRPCSTIRSWVAARRFKGAYKLSPRDWRVPAAALRAFIEARQPAVPSPSDGPPIRRRTHRAVEGADSADLGAWRAQARREPG